MLKARAYVDVACPYTWQSLANLSEWRQGYPGLLDFEYVVFPRFRSKSDLDPTTMRLYKLPDMAAHQAEVALTLGQPAACSIWQTDPPVTSAEAARWHLAAREQGVPAANQFFETIITMCMGQGKNPDHPDVLRTAGARACLDVNRLARSAADSRVADEFEKSASQARARGIRFRPTIIMQGSGREFWLVGPQSADSLVRAAELAAQDRDSGEAVIHGSHGAIADDLDVRSRLAVPGGWRLDLAQGDDLAPGAKAPVWQEVLVYNWPEAGAVGPEFAAFLHGCWQAEILLGWAAGLDEHGQPHRLMTVRAAAASPTAAGFRVREQAGIAEGLAGTLLGKTLQPAPPAALAWLEALPEADGPLITLHWTPGLRGGDFEGAPAALVTVADPVPMPAIQAEMQWLEDLRQRWESRRQQDQTCTVALTDSLAYLEAQLIRLDAARRQGCWTVFTAVVPPIGGAAAAYGAIARIHAAPEAPFPLRTALVEGRAAAHLRRHIAALNVCREKELHGKPAWSTYLPGTELMRYWQ